MERAEQINAIIGNARENGGSIPKMKRVNGVWDYQGFADALGQNVNWENEFINAYARIAQTVITSRIWENPLNFLFKSQNYGYAIEELFVNVSRPQSYDPYGPGEEQWKRVMPDVRKMLHTVNVRTLVKQTVYEEGIRTAVVNEDSWNQLRQKLVDAVTNTLSLSLYSACVYLMALYALDAGIVTVNVNGYESNPEIATTALKIASEKMTFYSPDYTPTGVYNFCPKERQYLIVTPEFNATQEVEVLAYMFQVQMGELPQRRIVVNNFWQHDYTFLSQIFEGGVPRVFSGAEVEALKHVPALLVADDLFFIYKLFDRWEAPWNSEKLYFNYMHHWQGTMSYSPFACGIALYAGEEKLPTAIQNPYESTEIKVGRDNLFFVLPAFTQGALSSKAIINGVVDGEALIEDVNYPGWYRAVNKRGETATITYSYTGLQSLIINITVV